MTTFSVYQKKGNWYASIIEEDRLKRIKIDDSLIHLLKKLGNKKGYSLVATCLSDAIFVRDDLIYDEKYGCVSINYIPTESPPTPFPTNAPNTTPPTKYCPPGYVYDHATDECLGKCLINEYYDVKKGKCVKDCSYSWTEWTKCDVLTGTKTRDPIINYTPNTRGKACPVQEVSNSGTFTFDNGVTRIEFDELKRTVLEMKDLLIKAKEIDAKTNQPDCEQEEKIKILKERIDIMKQIVAGIPVGRLGEPEEIARAVVFLAADEAAFITGETISINGGQYME